MKYADLHLHTRYSDGSNTPEQLVVDCSEIGLDVIAITDHDHTQGYLDALPHARDWGIELMTGVEISTPDYHILGYGFNIENQEFQQLLERSRKLQDEIVKQRIKSLNQQGIPITFEKLNEYFPNARKGKGTLVTAIVRDPDCREVTGVKSARKIYEAYFNREKMPKIRMDELTVKEAVDGIHQAGGIAILAHPFKDVGKTLQEVLDTEEILDRLFETGLDGLEIQPNYGDRNHRFREYANKHNLIVTYGSDYHGARLRNRPLLGRDDNLVKKFW